MAAMNAAYQTIRRIGIMKPDKSEIELTCKNFLDAFQGKLTWKWDERTQTALAEINKDDEELVRNILHQNLNISWDDSNMESAPDTVRIIDSHLGKIRDGQELFTSDPDQAVFVFCAWWPWGNGKTVSVRMSPYGVSLSDAEKTEISNMLKVMCASQE